MPGANWNSRGSQDMTARDQRSSTILAAFSVQIGLWLDGVL